MQGNKEETALAESIDEPTDLSCARVEAVAFDDLHNGGASVASGDN
jgi:hypothetical protein